MVKLLVLYHSMYGHIETMAQHVAEGARSVPGVEVTIKRVPEVMDPEAFKAAHGKTDQAAPIATPPSFPVMTQLSLAPQHASGICQDRCVTSSIKLAVCGRQERWSARSRVYSHPQVLVVARR